MFLPAPLDLADFPEILTSRTVYSFTDIAFMSRRDVARSLLKSVTEKLSQYAGNQRALFPLDFERLLRNGWVEGFRLQTFPDIGSPELRAAIASGHPNKCMALLRHYRRELENAGDVPSFSGHWRFRPETPEYQAWERDGKLAPDTQMCSVKHCASRIHVPEDFTRGTGATVAKSRWRDDGSLPRTIHLALQL